jgi:hypothetical protein
MGTSVKENAPEVVDGSHASVPPLRGAAGSRGDAGRGEELRARVVEEQEDVRRAVEI